MNNQFAGTPMQWVMPCSGSPITRSAKPGSNARMITVLPPLCSIGVEKQFNPPVWNSGRNVRPTEPQCIFSGADRLIAFVSVMP